MSRSAALGSEAADRRSRPGGPSLVTGGGGFAGRHLLALLGERGHAPVAPAHSELELLDGAAVERTLGELQPDTVFHLAAFSSPRLSWEQPDEAVLGNLRMTLNLLEGARRASPDSVLVLVGSGQAYGRPRELPLSEDAPLDPANPYAVSKAACDMLGRQYAEAFGLRVVRLRPFNHAGPGQSDEYVVSTLARQVAAAEAKGAPEVVVSTGDTSVARDFSDVRDVVCAYALAARAEPGAYNVCSGRAVAVERLIELLAGETAIPVRAEVDPARLRPDEVPEVFGTRDRLTAATGWEPSIPLEQTVRDTLGWWRERLSATR